MKQHLVFMAWALILIGMLGIVPVAAVESSLPDATMNDSVLARPDHPCRTALWSILQQQSEYDPVLGEMIAQVDETEIYRSTYDLQSFSTRRYPSGGNRQAASYLYTRLDAIPGLEVAYQSDRYRNVIASLPGKDTASDTVVIVGAHYDSMSSDSTTAPGATDDGVGVAIVLELARVMSQYQFNHTIQFAFWNAEESGMDGSAEYVAGASERTVDIPLYVNYDSSCYDPENEYILDIMYNKESKPFADQMAEYNSEYGINFNLTFNAHDYASDHILFREAGYPAISTHSQSRAPQAHSPDDTVDLISSRYAKKSTQLGMVILAETANRPIRMVVPPVVLVPVTEITTSPDLASPTPSPVVAPTVTSAGSPGFTFGARRYVVGAVPNNPPAGIAGGSKRSVSVGVRSKTIGTDIAKGTTPPANRFVRWSPYMRWRAGRTPS